MKPQTDSGVAPHDDAEKRPVTLMFCDMVGSTDLTRQLGAENMAEVMAVFLTSVNEIVRQYEGAATPSQGDGVLARFGDPEAHEDDAVQAVRAGLALIDAIPQLKISANEPLQIRVGIATGKVVVGGLFAGDGPGDRAVVGDAPNLAKRLQTMAEPGTVLICADTHRLTEGYFKFRDLGPKAVKGWAEEKQVWQVLEASGVESRFEATHKTKLPPLIGREEEIELLYRRWDEATQGKGKVVLITGEPGIGKSHIALALDEQLQTESCIILRYYCSAHHTYSALFPIIRQLQRAARFERADSDKEKLAKLEALLTRSTSDKGDVVLLADLLSLPCDVQSNFADVRAEERKKLTIEALFAQLKGLASHQPVFMIFEDVHWIDPTSRELLLTIVERASTLPLLLLVTAREEEFTPPWQPYDYTKTIQLTRLGEHDCTELIERVTGGKSLPEELMGQILARTDGVPLFVEELTKTMLESGLLNERSSQYEASRPVPSQAIPDTLHASLMARLDRLAPVRELAQIGAVIGREFSYELLSAVADLPKEQLENALSQLVESELVFRRGEIPQAVYTFKHVLVRDVAYAGLLQSRRSQLHGVIANTLEKEFSEIAETQPETLGHHFTEAGELERATEYWLEAGKNAHQRSANVEAIVHLQKGADIVSSLPEGSERDRSELDLQYVLAQCLIATQGPASADAMAAFVRARELCERLGDPPEHPQVLFWLTTASVMRGELLRASESINDSLRLAESRSDRPAFVNAMRGHGMILLFMGQVVDAHTAIERAVMAFDSSDEADRLATRVAGQDAGVANLSLMSWALWVRGYADQAVERIESAVQRSSEIEHPHSQAYAHYYASVLHALREEHSHAGDHAERCLGLSEEHDFKQWLGPARAISNICAASLEEPTETSAELNKALVEYGRSGYHIAMTVVFVLSCPVLLDRGQFEFALEVIDRGLATADRTNERLFEAELYRLKAKALIAQGGDPDVGSQTQSLLRKALDIAKKQDARSIELRAATDLAALWIQQGHRAEALELLAPVYDWFTDGIGTPTLRNAKALLDQLR